MGSKLVCVKTLYFCLSGLKLLSSCYCVSQSGFIVGNVYSTNEQQHVTTEHCLIIEYSKLWCERSPHWKLKLETTFFYKLSCSAQMQWLLTDSKFTDSGSRDLSDFCLPTAFDTETVMPSYKVCLHCLLFLLPTWKYRKWMHLNLCWM